MPISQLASLKVTSRKGTRWVAVLLALFFLAPRVLSAQGTEILRGKVTGPDKKPLPDVSVVITGLVTQSVSTTTTNDKGIYTALFTNAEGDYILTVRKIGYAPITTRVTRTGISSVLVTDFTLSEQAVVLDSITALGRKLDPSSGLASVGGVELNALANAQFLLDPSDLLALALTVPGVTNIGDSAYSVLGADQNSNNTTVDGVKTGATNIPVDAIQSSRMITTTADVSRSGFAGGSLSNQLRTGSDIFAATMRGTFVNPTLSWADPSYPRPPSTNASMSGSISGPIKKKRAHYITSWNMNNVTTDIYTLLNAQPSILSQYGLVRDTIDAVSSALAGLGIPRSLSGVPNNQLNRGISTTTVLDFSPTASTTLKLQHIGNWNDSRQIGGVTSYPTGASKFNFTYQQFILRGSTYFHGFLDELVENFSYSHNESDPYLELPSASVRIGTVFDGGTTGLGSLRFGGGGSSSVGHGYTTDLTNETSWLTSNSKHKLKVGEEFEFDWNTNYSAGNQFGSYSYLTLADLQANQPASFTRTLDALERSSKGSTTSLYMGDEFTASKAWNFQYGWRVDAAHPGTFPQYNPVVDTVFGIHTDRVPNDIGFTPRFGFSWTSKARRGIGSPGGSSGPLNGLSAAQLAQFPPELLMSLLNSSRASTTALPGISVSGTLGGYKQLTSTGQIANLVDQTGLPDTRRTLSCVGPATPIPDWSTIAGSPPDECLDGTGGTVFSTNTPTVRVYDPSFRSPVSWRGNLGVDGIRIPYHWVMGVTGTFSYGVNAQSGIDLNLNRTPGFTLASEGNRPVYVAPSAIVTTTGAIAPGAYRIDPNFGSVTNVISDLHNYAENLALTVVPPHPLLHGKASLSLTYSWTHSRAESRALGGNNFFVSEGGGGFAGGFGGGAGTAGDPFLKEWIPGSTPTHQFTVNAGFRAWWFNINVRAQVWSGYPFTPMVSGDINGDGSGNDDRAFIPNPKTTTDTLLAAQMNQLLANGTGAALNCISSQMGHIAGANTCHTPWQARMDFAMNFAPPSSWGYGDRLRITTNMLNASGALVRLLGLENTPLGQSASSPSPNPTLLYVTGFDPVTNRFKYQVNQLFGEPVNFGNALHKFPAFQMQVGLQYQLGGPVTQPMSRGMGFIPPGKEPPLTPDQIKHKLTVIARNPVPAILALKDSIRLTPAQVTKLDSINTVFKQRSDSMLAPLSEWLIKKGRHVTDDGLSPRLSKVQPSLNKMAAEASKASLALLSPGQRALMPRSMAGGASGLPGAAPAGARPAPGGVGVPPAAKSGGGEDIPQVVKAKTGGGGGD